MPVTPRTDPFFHEDETPVDETDETLVAYLDGELDEVSRRELEERLFADAQLRQRLSELQVGWEMLDHLPPATVTEDFARTTLEMVAAGQSRILATERGHWPWRGAAWLLAVTTLSALLAALGYWVPSFIDQQRYYSQLDDLPLAEHLDAYLVDADLDLMVALSKSERWNGAMRLGMDAGGIAMPVAMELDDRDQEERIAMVKSADRDVRSALSANWDRLHSLSEQQWAQVRERYLAVRQLENPDDVLRTMEQYAAWWNQLSPESKDRIVSATPQQKLDVIFDTLERTSRNWLLNYGMSLSETDRQLIYTRLIQIAGDRLQRAKDFVRSQVEYDQWQSARRRDLSELTAERLLFRIAGRANFEYWRRLRHGDSPPGEREEDRGAVSDEGTDPPDFSNDQNRSELFNEMLYGPLDEDELWTIYVILSPQAQLVLNGEANSGEEPWSTLWRWCVEIILQSAPRGDNSEMMLQLYESLDPDYRDLLDLREPDEMFDELRQHRRRR